jgi:hypothetical protein
MACGNATGCGLLKRLSQTKQSFLRARRRKSSAPQPEVAESLSLLRNGYIVKENGCDALHLPPYHPDINHFEFVWGEITNRVTQECL